MTKQQIRLQGLSDYPMSKESRVEFIDTNTLPCFDKDYNSKEFVYHTPTLKDVAIILNVFVGQGVMWQLSREISERLDINLEDVNKTVQDIVHRYANMPDTEAIHMWDIKANYIKEKRN